MRPHWLDCQTIRSETRRVLAGDLADWLHWGDWFPSDVKPSCPWLTEFDALTFTTTTEDVRCP
jgi:hypothetical protein